MECFYCGKTGIMPFITKDLMQEKLERLEQIKRMISQTMVLTANSKRMIVNFANSRIR